jgi:hypothetical protein
MGSTNWGSSSLASEGVLIPTSVCFWKRPENGLWLAWRGGTGNAEGEGIVIITGSVINTTVSTAAETGGAEDDDCNGWATEADALLSLG